MVWSRNDSWMVTADQGGYVKYWQSNMNNVKMFQAHKEPVRAIRWGSSGDVFTVIIILFIISCNNNKKYKNLSNSFAQLNKFNFFEILFLIKLVILEFSFVLSLVCHLLIGHFKVIKVPQIFNSLTK